MFELDNLVSSTNTLARRGLLVSLALAWAGDWVGVFAMRSGDMAGYEMWLVSCSLFFVTGAMVTILFFRRVALQSVATAATIFFAVNLCAGMVIAAFGVGDHFNLLVYLVWFFPLMVFNKLVNKRSVGRTIVRFLLAAPLLFVLCVFFRLQAVLRTELLILLIVYCLSYLCFGLMFNVVTRYREEYLVERERAEGLRLEAEVLESISDCFISLDSASRLVYLNDAACAEFGVDRRLALGKTLWDSIPAQFSVSMLAGMAKATDSVKDTLFEVETDEQQQWYTLRCYKRLNGMSVYFRNITEDMLSRRELEKAQKVVREQAELLAKARDAIYVVDMEYRFSYWNKGAERLYGWSSDEVLGREVSDIFQYDTKDMLLRAAAVLNNGEWSGEVTQRHSDGRTMVVENRVTLVKNEHGQPQSMLAINNDITDRKAAEAKMEYLAYYDSLTELPNQQLLNERIEGAVNKAVHDGTSGALFNIDLDDFKTLNATLGHDVGDLLLKQAAIRLMSCMEGRYTASRFGGDEFAVLLEGLGGSGGTPEEEARAIGEKILDVFRQPYMLGVHESFCTASIGITLFPEWGEDPAQLFKQANMAMYRAKAEGRDTIRFYDPSMQAEVMARAALSADLRRALPNSQFELHYQPQVARDGQVTGAEALLRWRHPQRGMVPPNEFIPVAEDIGLILEIGQWVLDTACWQLAIWAEHPKLEPLSVAVNVSVCQFLDPNFVRLVNEALKKTGANPRRLKLEITESSVMDKVDDVIAKMASLNAQGVVFSMDDFGTGYSSLSHLKRLPLNQLKIDRSFVKDVLSNDKNASITRTIISLGLNLGLNVIAEGVETEEQRQFLQSEGCHAFQGFLFSPALAAARFETYFESTQSAEDVGPCPIEPTSLYENQPS